MSGILNPTSFVIEPIFTDFLMVLYLHMCYNRSEDFWKKGM